jgi:hypothetical protein
LHISILISHLCEIVKRAEKQQELSDILQKMYLTKDFWQGDFQWFSHWVPQFICMTYYLRGGKFIIV